MRFLAPHILYSGEWLDQSIGLQYLRSRWYSPEVGRFMSQDTVETPDGPYSYTGGRPTMGVDPSGHFTLVEVMVVVAITYVLATIVESRFISALAHKRGNNVAEVFIWYPGTRMENQWGHAEIRVNGVLYSVMPQWGIGDSLEAYDEGTSLHDFELEHYKARGGRSYPLYLTDDDANSVQGYMRSITTWTPFDTCAGAVANALRGVGFDMPIGYGPGAWVGMGVNVTPAALDCALSGGWGNGGRVGVRLPRSRRHRGYAAIFVVAASLMNFNSNSIGLT